MRELCDTLEGDERTGAKIVLKALEAPLRQIAKNAGLEGSVIIDKIISANKPNYGFDAQNEVFVDDMIAAGIVDPTKVTRSALENAASVAEMVLTTESLVADLPEPPAAPAAAGGDMGGMGGCTKQRRVQSRGEGCKAESAYSISTLWRRDLFGDPVSFV